MRHVVFESSVHPNGGCVFDQQLIRPNVVFESSVHPNGGCIFDIDGRITSGVEQGGGSGRIVEFRAPKPKPNQIIFADEEEAVILAMSLYLNKML